MACGVMSVTRLCFLVTSLLHAASCFAPPELFPFGTETGDYRGGGGSSSTGLSKLEPFKYFGSYHTWIFANANGYLSFGRGSWRHELTLSNLPKKRGTPAIIAPFWNRCDYTRGGRKWWRQSRDPDLLNRASNEIGRPFTAAWIVVVTWDFVPFWGANTEGRLRRNAFQVVLAADKTREKSYAIFNYQNLDWSASVYNGGRPESGMGGTSPAIVGFDSGDGTNFVELPGSFTDDNILVAKTSNVGVPGKWIFNIANKPIGDTCYKNGPCKKGICYKDGNGVEKCNCTGTGFIGPTCNLAPP